MLDPARAMAFGCQMADILKVHLKLVTDIAAAGFQVPYRLELAFARRK
jgi:hypothetical protein